MILEINLFIKKKSRSCGESESEVAQSCPTLCDPMGIAHQAPPSMGFSSQEYWSGLPCPSPGDLPDPGIEPALPHCGQMLYPLSHQGSPKLWYIYIVEYYSAIKRNKFESVLVRWMNIEPAIQSEIRKTKTNITC